MRKSVQKQFLQDAWLGQHVGKARTAQKVKVSLADYDDSQTNPFRLLINVLKYFRYSFRICRDFQLFVHSAYSQYTYRFVPCILSIQTDSFRLFSVMNRFIPCTVFSVFQQPNFVWRFTSFRVLSVYIHILSADSQFMNISRNLVISVYVQIQSVYSELLQLLKGYYFKLSMYVCNWTNDLQGIIYYLALAGQKNFFSCILVICRLTLLLKYLGNFKFILENNLG